MAADDFAAIYEYTLLNFPALQADNYTNDLENALQLIASSPLLGHECSDIAEGIRRHDHQQHVIFYRQRERGVLVVRILHQQMEPLKYFDGQ